MNLANSLTTGLFYSRWVKCLLSASLLFSLFTLTGCEQLMLLRMNSQQLTETKVDGNRLYLKGIINGKSFEHVKQVLNDNPQLDTLVLTVMPGSIDDEVNLQMCHFVREKGLNTYLLHNSVIASGAVDLFMSGVERKMEEGAMLGVHSWSDGFKEALDYPQNAEEHAPYRVFYQSMVGSDEFYWYTLRAARADDIHWMTDAEIQRYPVLTSPVKKPSFEAPVFADLEQYREEVLSDD
ncbi:hypothetical protein [Pseudoteredinibacter isoporae]|uniref:Beta-lactamase class D n=1 Tax=Pseudoteredinibacter isoporae TaxID=570281 RepID=A0A7X0JS29_9GAMM|nr:hypothetical protein [Pseudoteredinibacter isoporae]MBB6521248.1 beta-lactamase class D [Pseudoteredinibacter isoporae]NHO86806.1 hypothetical protein [Pseudoteredinibacter isoporae]NIB24742.1 hypothetical protein [Pseudoteredinibacter isoporae]